MLLRTLVGDGADPPRTVAEPELELDGTSGWMWIDVVAGPDDVAELLTLTDRLELDRLAVRDAVVDVDLPKVDDFDDHLLIVFHGLRPDRVATYEVHCFLTDRHLLTVHDQPSPAVDELWEQLQQRSELASVSTDQLAGLLADLLTRRLMAVLDTFDELVEDLTERALRTDPTLLADLSALRADLAAIRRAVHPQRELLDLLRRSSSKLVSDPGRRRFSDVFDVASRATAGLDEARSALAETLDAYRGAEARQATEVTKVLTIYAAVMLPLSLVAGFFGMNFEDLPLTGRRWGWLAATGLMVAIALVSLGVFVALGWMRRPSGRRAGATLGKGLIEATLTPAHLMGAVFEMTTLPLRATGERLTRRSEPHRPPGAAPSEATDGRDDQEPVDPGALRT